MKLQVEEKTIRMATVAPEGRLDAFIAPELRAGLEELLADGVARLVIDLSRVPFIDSAGLAVLVTMLKRARQAGGDVKLVWPAEEAGRRIFKLTKFDRVFDMTETEEQARQLF